MAREGGYEQDLGVEVKVGIEEMECEQHGRFGCESEKEGYGLGGASATKMRADKVQVQVGNERQ